MPYSIVIEAFSNDKKNRLRSINGAQLQGAFLNLIQRVDPTLAKELHDENSLRRYSLALLNPRPGQIREAGLTSIKLRVACLDDRIYPALLKLALSQDKAAIRLNKAEFQVSRLVTTPEGPDSWSGFATIEELQTVEVGVGGLPKTYTLQFMTPTFFRQGDRDDPMPLPEYVFGSLADRWHVAAPWPDYDSKAFRQLIRGQVTVSHFSGETVSADIGDKLRRTGFIGEVTYRPHDGLVLAYCNILSRVAFFSGVGAKTSRGMGLVRMKKPSSG